MRRLLVVLLSISVIGLIASPVSAAAKYRLGLKAGLALADLGGSDVNSDATNLRTGFAGGLFGQADFSDNFGLRLEALYHMKGASEDSAGVKVTYKFDYVEFPLLLVGQVPASKAATFSAFAGPVFAFNTKSDFELSAGGASVTVDAKDYFKTFEFAMDFGLGAAFQAGSAVITLDGRYQLGLTTLDDTLGTSGGLNRALDIKNRGWTFMAGVGFPVGGKK